jgi:hypothetical protein
MTKQVISVDWDNTIILWPGVTKNLDAELGRFAINEQLVKELVELQEAGNEIHITTFRGKDIGWVIASDEIEGSIEAHIPGLTEEYGLRISEIHYTNGECKTNALKRMNAAVHYDDSSEVCCVIAMFTNTFPIFVDHGENNATLEELISNGKAKRWKLKQ